MTAEKLYGISDKRIHKRDLHDLIDKIQASIRSVLKREGEKTKEMIFSAVWMTVYHNIGMHEHCTADFCSKEASLINFNENVTPEFFLEAVRRCFEKISLENYCEDICTSESTR